MHSYSYTKYSYSKNRFGKNGAMRMKRGTFLLGVDGGGSKTLALLANRDGQIVNRATAGTSNHFVVGFEQATAALESAMDGVLSTVNRDDIAAVCLGLAGMDRPADRAFFAPWVSQRFANAQVILVNDAQLVLAAGTPNGWGIALICGTGSIVIGRNQAGEQARSDGWGYLLGDLGGGYAIGLAALRAVMAAYDGRGQETKLTQTILQHCAVESPVKLLPWVYRDRVPTAEIATISQLVDEAATQGDSVAQSIQRNAVIHLTESVVAVANRLELCGKIPFATAGGAITRSSQMVDQLCLQTSANGLVLDPFTPVPEPAVGAIRLAQQATDAD